MPKRKNKRKNGKPTSRNGYRPHLTVVDEAQSSSLIRVNRDRLPNDAKAWTEIYHSYVCDTCIGGYSAVDLDEGATPMFGPCLRTEGCDGTARSMMDFAPMPYLSSNGESFPLLVEFYRPSNMREIRNESPEVVSHVIRGGLMRRPSKNAPKWVRALL